MSAEKTGFWYLLISSIHTILKWLDARFSRKSKQMKDADAMMKEALKEKDPAKLQAAIDRLRRIKK